MYAVKNLKTGEIVEYTNTPQSAFGGPFHDSNQFEFIPDSVRPKSKEEVSASITAEADQRIDQVGGDLRGQLRKLMKTAKLQLSALDRLMSAIKSGGVLPADVFGLLASVDAGEARRMDGMEKYFTAVRTAEKAALNSLAAMTQGQLNTFDPAADIAWPAPSAKP